MIHLRVRYINNVAVVGVGAHAAGEPLPDGSVTALVRGGGRAVVMDIPADTFFSSAVLGDIIAASRAAAGAGRAFRLCCPAGVGRGVIAVTKLDRLLPVFDTLADALDGL